MGMANLVLQRAKLLWSHLSNVDIYFFPRKWRILCKVPCFAVEGNHPRLKRMLRNNEA